MIERKFDLRRDYREMKQELLESQRALQRCHDLLIETRREANLNATMADDYAKKLLRIDRMVGRQLEKNSKYLEK